MKQLMNDAFRVVVCIIHNSLKFKPKKMLKIFSENHLETGIDHHTENWILRSKNDDEL